MAGRGEDRRSSSQSSQFMQNPRSATSDRELRSSQSGQHMMNAWLSNSNNPNTAAQAQASELSFPDMDPEQDPHDIDIKKVILEISRDVKKTNQKFDNLESSINELKTEQNRLKTENQVLTKKWTILQTR
ncbi:MAG: hypothetical protein ABW185_21070 [Sedimenticola sp.]